MYDNKKHRFKREYFIRKINSYLKKKYTKKHFSCYISILKNRYIREGNKCHYSGDIYMIEINETREIYRGEHNSTAYGISKIIVNDFFQYNNYYFLKYLKKEINNVCKELENSNTDKYFNW